MKILISFPVVIILSVFVTGLKAQDIDLHDYIDKRTDAIFEYVVEWRRHFHQYLELSNREFETAKVIEVHLCEMGFDVETGITHTGVVGVLQGGKPGPVVALCADMDALPVEERVDVPFASIRVSEYMGEEVPVMQACGHDAHMAMMMGVVQILTELQEELPGTVKFIFQPAEEGTPPGEMAEQK